MTDNAATVQDRLDFTEIVDLVVGKNNRDRRRRSGRAAGKQEEQQAEKQITHGLNPGLEVKPRLKAGRREGGDFMEKIAEKEREA